jgi:hypothetical protein
MLTLGRNPFELRFFVNWHEQAISQVSQRKTVLMSEMGSYQQLELVF